MVRSFIVIVVFIETLRCEKPLPGAVGGKRLWPARTLRSAHNKLFYCHFGNSRKMLSFIWRDTKWRLQDCDATLLQIRSFKMLSRLKNSGSPGDCFERLLDATFGISGRCQIQDFVFRNSMSQKKSHHGNAVCNLSEFRKSNFHKMLIILYPIT